MVIWAHRRPPTGVICDFFRVKRIVCLTGTDRLRRALSTVHAPAHVVRKSPKWHGCPSTNVEAHSSNRRTA